MNDMPRVPERGRLLNLLHRGRSTRWGNDPGVLDLDATMKSVGAFGTLFGPRRYFRLEARGFEGVPQAPCLFVSNHSGGTMIPDAWGFVIAWYRHFGRARPLAVLAHELVFALESTGRYFARRGLLRASMQSARNVVTGFARDVLVMPGGERDTWRPHSERWKVQFAGRTGYARLAIELGIPIVPVANGGAHDTLWVLSDGHRLARAIGLQRLVRAEVFPIHLSVPWGLAIGPWPHVPLPVTLRYRVGTAIVPPPGPPVRTLDQQVRSAVQGLLDELALG
jgi:1-acyl-sn-glycerol-3-phosphate acyltransferase